MRAQNRFEQSFKKGALVTPSPILLMETRASQALILAKVEHRY